MINAAPGIKVNSPQNGAVWLVGSYQAITWGEQDWNQLVGGSSTTVSVTIWRDNTQVATVATKVPFGRGYAQYQVPSGIYQYNLQSYYAVVETEWPSPYYRGVSGKISFKV
ncbi:hypothetical protein G9A89_005693 [Geosiphon pyriformis]|nr:hypothetical protein G9A89_005693 [Geosiphon pyriformis]